MIQTKIKVAPLNKVCPPFTIFTNQTIFGGRRSLGLPVNSSLAVPENLSLDWLELDEKVRSMMEKSQNNLDNRHGCAYLCKVCGKEGRDHVIKDHIEANHLEGIVNPCNLCEKTSALASIWGFTRQNIIRIRLPNSSYLPSKLLLNWSKGAFKNYLAGFVC